MSTARKRRFVKRAIVAMSVVVLLLSSYVAGWAVQLWFAGYEVRGGPKVTYKWINGIFEPVIFYQRQEWPGYRTLGVFGVWCYTRGSGEKVTWDEIAASQDELYRKQREQRGQG
jgi:hypothetical protein